ncbi:Nuclear pore complex nucleoporin component, partial [Thoreauomyces humboldtii]
MKFGYYDAPQGYEEEGDEDELGLSLSLLSILPEPKQCSPIKPATNRKPTKEELWRAMKAEKDREAKVRQSETFSKQYRQKVAQRDRTRARVVGLEDVVQRSVRDLEAFRKTLPERTNEVRSVAEAVCREYRPSVVEAEAICVDGMRKVKERSDREVERQRDEIQALADGIESRKREKQRQEDQLRREEEARRSAARQAEEEALRKSAQESKEQAQAKAQAKAEATRKLQAAEERARLAKTAEAEKAALAAQNAQAANDAKEAEARGQAQKAAKASVPQSGSTSDSVEGPFAARLEKVNKIRSELKPLIKTGQNQALKQTVFQARMVFTRRLGQIVNSQAKIIEIAKEINEQLKNARSQSPEAYLLCQEKLAKLIIKQAEGEVAVKRDAAFPLALLCVMLYNAHTDFLDILLGCMFRKCPYVVKVSFSKKPGESEDDFRSRLGYKKVNGAWETLVQNGERMAGIIALYAAIVQTTLVPHSHAISEAWAWMARVLNGKPRRIASQLILVFLE